MGTCSYVGGNEIAALAALLQSGFCGARYAMLCTFRKYYRETTKIYRIGKVVQRNA